jgi:hypothetical protein
LKKFEKNKKDFEKIWENKKAPKIKSNFKACGISKKRFFFGGLLIPFYEFKRACQ